MIQEERIQRRRTTETHTAGRDGGGETSTTERRVVETSPSGAEMLRRLVIFGFGLIQLLIALRIGLLLLDAREANAIVDFVLSASQIFVAPFEGIFQTDAIGSEGSVFDVAAAAAFIGWTIIELIVLGLISLFRRERV